MATKKELLENVRILIKKHFKYSPFHNSINSFSKQRLQEFVDLYGNRNIPEVKE